MLQKGNLQITPAFRQPKHGSFPSKWLVLLLVLRKYTGVGSQKQSESWDFPALWVHWSNANSRAYGLLPNRTGKWVAWSLVMHSLSWITLGWLYSSPAAVHTLVWSWELVVLFKYQLLIFNTQIQQSGHAATRSVFLAWINWWQTFTQNRFLSYTRVSKIVHYIC